MEKQCDNFETVITMHLLVLTPENTSPRALIAQFINLFGEL